ncbi:hypothetical protein [Cesiribacter sp. SM1]|uniref:hypothetical protein n=1 Tax=Cesiribacter sp. SM1 TaxID=2861196 RepID=UPI001CD243F6|nr:hypothetical protein [Cesiribacter sp. SM1]
MKALILLLANTLSLLITLAVNYTAGTGAISSKSIGDVSDEYPTLLTAAGYAFSIWGLIYLMLVAFTAYQWYAWFKGRNRESLLKAGIWFFMANLANALWVFAWLTENLGLSVLIILFLLFSLTRLVIRLELETWDAPLRIIIFVWWPVCIYLGWIVLATVINISVYLESLGVLANLMAPELWAILVLVLASLIYLFLTWSRNMREAALVGVWGLVAIAYKQWNNHDAVAITALLAAAVLFLYAGYHGIKNMDTSPLAKAKRGEW